MSKHTYIALTTTNYQTNGYHELCRGTDKTAVLATAKDMIGNVATAYGTDIYKTTEQRNLIVISRTEAERKGYIERP